MQQELIGIILESFYLLRLATFNLRDKLVALLKLLEGVIEDFDRCDKEGVDWEF